MLQKTHLLLILAISIIAMLLSATASRAGCELNKVGVDVTRQLTNSDTSALTTAATYKRDIRTCDVSGVTDMSSMFMDALSFSQDLRSWDVAHIFSRPRDFSAMSSDLAPLDVTLTFDASSVHSGPFTATFTFLESITGFTAEDMTVTNGTFAETTLGRIFTLVITPELSAKVLVFVDANKTTDAAGNNNEASNTFRVSAGSPAAVFDEHRAENLQVIVDEASRSLRSSVTANRCLGQSAREEDLTRALIPFDVDGSLTLSQSGLNTSGNFFQQVGNEEGTYRRLFFGDFDVQHDQDTDSTTATLTGRMA